MGENPLERALEIEGATSLEELSHLYELAQCVRDGCIVEVGSWRGRSTAALALGSRKGYGVPVYAIEPHEDFKGIYGGHFGSADRIKFVENLLKAEVMDIVRLVNLSSEIVAAKWPAPVGLLWIDGDHRYEAVRRDVLCWLPHLRPDATIALHDATDSRIGPYHVVEELVRGGQWTKVADIGKIKTLTAISSRTLAQGTG